MNIPFPYVMEDLDKELIQWKTEYEQMGHKKENIKIEDMSSTLGSALDKVPEMTERKKRIDMHTNLATHLTSEIEDRKLDVYFELESSLIFNKYLNSKEREDLINLLTQGKTDSQKYVFDKARLISVHLQSIAEPPTKDAEKIDQILSEIQDKLSPNLKKYLDERRLKAKSSEQDEKSESSSRLGLKMFRGLASKVTSSSKGILVGVQNMLSSGKNFTSVKLVADILENKNYLANEGINQKNLASKVDNLKKTDDIIVFMVDGGCLNEYQNFCELGNELKKKLSGNMLYGSSYLYNAQEFLHEV